MFTVVEIGFASGAARTDRQHSMLGEQLAAIGDPCTRSRRCSFPREHPGIHHLFEPKFDGWPSEQPETVAVIGGGITTGQVALRLAQEGHRVHLIARHALRQHHFDSDPGWLGPKHMTKFSRVRAP